MRRPTSSPLRGSGQGGMSLASSCGCHASHLVARRARASPQCGGSGFWRFRGPSPDVAAAGGDGGSTGAGDGSMDAPVFRKAASACKAHGWSECKFVPGGEQDKFGLCIAAAAESPFWSLLTGSVTPNALAAVWGAMAWPPPVSTRKEPVGKGVCFVGMGACVLAPSGRRGCRACA